MLREKQIKDLKKKKNFLNHNLYLPVLHLSRVLYRRPLRIMSLNYMLISYTFLPINFLRHVKDPSTHPFINTHHHHQKKTFNRICPFLVYRKNRDLSSR